MGRKYYIDPATGEKVYIRDKVPSMAQYRKKSDQDEIDTQIKEDLTTKLTEPTSGLAVGKYFKVSAIDENGHAVLEAVDLPVANATDSGVVSADIGNTYGISVVNGKIRTNPALAYQINARTNSYAPITPITIVRAVDSVLCSTATTEALTTTQQAAARARLGIEKEWVLKGMMNKTTTTVTVDMTGCTEMIVFGKVKGNFILYFNTGKTIIPTCTFNILNYFKCHFMNDKFGFEPISSKYGVYDTCLTSEMQTYSRINDGISDIVTFYTSDVYANEAETFEVEIYAR